MRAYKVKWVEQPTHQSGKRETIVLFAPSMTALYERLHAAAFPIAATEGELHITPLGEVQ